MNDRSDVTIFQAVVIALLFLVSTAGAGAPPHDSLDDPNPAEQPFHGHGTVTPLRILSPDYAKQAEPNPLLAGAIEQIDRDSLYRTVADLEAFGTRYEFAAEQESAAVYLADRFSALGYEARFHHYNLTTWDVRAVSFADSFVGWMAMTRTGPNDSTVMLSSIDGGRSWDPVFEAELAVYGLAAISPALAWAGGTAGRLYRWDGDSWSLDRTLGDSRLIAIDFMDQDNGMVAGRNGLVWKTEDGGVTWQEISIPGAILYDIEYLDSVTVWTCGTSGRIWRYDGADWTVVSTPSNKTVRSLDFAGPGFGFAATSGTDGLLWDGSTWSSLPIDYKEGQVVAVQGDSTVWLVVHPLLTVVLRSENRGTTWEEVEFPFGLNWRSFNAVHLENDGGVFLAGFDGMIVGRSDNNAGWKIPDLPLRVAHPSRNVYAEKRGLEQPDQYVILSGHYDSIIQNGLADPLEYAPGADDDASGIAAILEAARVLADVPTSRSIRFLCFSGEELGLLGSIAYVTELKEAGAEIFADLQIDMIAFSDDGPLRVIANDPSEWILDRAIPLGEAYSESLDISYQISPEETFSDHAPFWANGYSAVQISETILPLTNALHTPGDTIGHLDFDFAYRSTRLATALAADLAGVMQPLDSPADIIAQGVCGGVSITWSLVQGAAEYAILRDGIVIDTSFGLPPVYFDQGAIENVQHEYEVETRAAGQTAGRSISVPAMRPYNRPGAPEGFSVNQSGQLSVVLSWEPLLTADELRVFKDGEQIASLPGNAVEWTDPDGCCGQVTYEVVAFNSCGASREKAADSLVTAPAGFVPYPNPAAATMAFPFRRTSGGETALTIYDAAGREVRRILAPAGQSGTTAELIWDLKGSDDRVVSPGIYFARIKNGSAVTTRKIVVVR